MPTEAADVVLEEDDELQDELIVPESGPANDDYLACSISVTALVYLRLPLA